MEDQPIVATLRTRIELLLRATKREGVEDLLKYLNRKGYFTKPCGFHHDMKGGLAWHSMEVLFGMMDANYLNIPLSSIVVVALLHELNRLSRNDSEKMAGSTAATIITKKAHFPLLPTEREAILLQNYSSSQIARMYSVPSCQVGNPIRSILRYANNMSVDAPKKWEDLVAIMNGQPVSPEVNEGSCIDEYDEQTSPSYYFNMYNRRIRPGLVRNDTYPHPRLKDPDQLRIQLKPASIGQMEEALNSIVEDNGIDMYVFYEFIGHRINQYHYKYYNKNVSEDQKIEMDGRLRDLCSNGASAATIAELLYGRENRHIFDQNWKISKVYQELEENFGLKLKLNSLQKAVQSVAW